jgi:hypothetical protein
MMMSPDERLARYRAVRERTAALAAPLSAHLYGLGEMPVFGPGAEGLRVYFCA